MLCTGSKYPEIVLFMYTVIYRSEVSRKYFIYLNEVAGDEVK